MHFSLIISPVNERNNVSMISLLFMVYLICDYVDTISTYVIQVRILFTSYIFFLHAHRRGMNGVICFNKIYQLNC